MDQAISLKDILAIAITNDNQHIYAAGGEFIIFKLELSSLTKLDLFEGHSGAVNDLILSPDDSHLFSVSDDGSLRKWQKNLKTSEIFDSKRKITLHARPQH
jgi:WD40 repeat protein